MQIPDLINSCFEGGGALMLLRNIRILHEHKIVRGISLLSTSFFFTWGLWNIFYYSHLNQWFSFSCGIAITIMNAVWLGQMFYYKKYPSGKLI